MPRTSYATWASVVSRPLAVGVDAQAKLEPAIRRYARRRLLVPRHHGDAPAGVDRGAVRRLLAEDRQAETDEPSVGLARALARAHGGEPDRGDRAAQAFGVVAAVEMLLGDVVEGHALGRHQILEAHVRGLEPGLARNGIEQELHREAHAGPCHAAERQDRAFVGGDRISAAAVGREIVRPRQDARDLRRLEAGGERIGGIGARIDRRLAVDREQPALAVRVAGDDVVVLAAIGGAR